MWQFRDDITKYQSISGHKVNDTWKYKFEKKVLKEESWSEKDFLFKSQYFLVVQ